MIMLSKLRHFDLADERVRLRDLALEPAENYPAASHLPFQNGSGKDLLLPWTSVLEVRRKSTSEEDLIKATLFHDWLIASEVHHAPKRPPHVGLN